MRAAFIVAALAASASAATLGRRQYPDCANPCLANADIGTCDQNDLGCLCRSPSFIDGTTKCIVSSCSADDAASAEATARQFCETVGVTLTSSPAGSSTASSPSSSAPGSSTPSSTPASSTGSSTPAPSSTAPPASSTGTTPAPSQSGSSSGAVSIAASTLFSLAAVAAVAFSL